METSVHVLFPNLWNLFIVNDANFNWSRSVLFSGWVAGLKIFLDMTDHVSCLVNIETVVVHAEQILGIPIQMMIPMLEQAYQELLC